MNADVVSGLKGAYRGFTFSVLFSVTGLVLELVVFAVWGSIILLTDIVHWAVDTVFEVFALVAVYYAIRVRKSFPWGVLVLESAVMLLSITIALGIYVVSFANYLVIEYSASSITTVNSLPAVGTAIGGVFTLLAFLVQKRNYERYGLEVLKVDYVHALLDLVASAVSTLGIAVVAYTHSANLEILFVFILMMFIVHSLVEVLKDVAKTVTGANVDHGLSMKLYKKLVEECHDVVVNDVAARKIGSFYVVEAKIGVKPSTRISTVHRIRKKVVKIIQAESQLIYHVDVKIYPLFPKSRKKAKH
ncbi:MAG: cation transporter [Desulfurococcaceae archaeon]